MVKYRIQIWREQSEDVIRDHPNLSYLVADKNYVLEMSTDALYYGYERWEEIVLSVLEKYNESIPAKVYVFPSFKGKKGFGAAIWESDWNDH